MIYVILFLCVVLYNFALLCYAVSVGRDMMGALVIDLVLVI